MSANFDPTQQSLDFTLPDGTIVPLPIPVINEYVQYGIRICINYGSQIGACMVLLILMAIITKPEKRQSAVFVLNALALVFDIIHKIILCTYFTGDFYNFYTYFSGDYSAVPKSDVATSIVGDIFRTFLVITIEGSLVLQVRAVCATMSRAFRMAVLILSALVALAVIGMRITLLAFNARAISNLEGFYNYQWLAASSLYMTTASICFFSAVFTAKLAVALKQRHSLGLRQFGPMQIIFIMGCQTLFIPAIFSILQWATAVPELGSQVETLVALFLPLSAMWASQSLGGAPPSSVINSKGRSGLFGFLSARGGKFFSRSSATKTAESKPSTVHSVPTLTNDSPTTPHFAMGKQNDLESGGMKIYRKVDLNVSSEKE